MYAIRSYYAGECDVPEFCNADGTCPADGFEPSGTACGDGSDTVCDDPDTCDGSGSCQDNHEPTSTECRADAGECDVPEFCNADGRITSYNVCYTKLLRPKVTGFDA